jgi:murein DD-endopeptidase MepM/ murein hydrolase activator NlpD
MKNFFQIGLMLIAAAFIFTRFPDSRDVIKTADTGPRKAETSREISGTIKKGETLFEVFKRCGLDAAELFEIREAAADVHRLRKVQPGQKYKISVAEDNKVDSLSYWIDDDGILEVTRRDQGFTAVRTAIEYEKKMEYIGGVIKYNLISSIGKGRERLMLALQLSDIFAWDVDFASDLREGDTFKIVVEGLYLEGRFKKFGNILSAELNNNGKMYKAFGFAYNGKTEYYDTDGRSLKKAFLKAPLNFRRISSYYSGRRLHPILKVYRPHHGLDYSAPVWTPVSAIGDGKIAYAGYKGGYGKLVIIRHRNGYETYYGHLSKIAKNIRTGKNVDQGQIIGNVGNSGLSTGPHLHFEVRINNKSVNPLRVRWPRGEPIPDQLLADFRKFRKRMDMQLASITPVFFASAEKMRDNDPKDDL